MGSADRYYEEEERQRREALAALPRSRRIARRMVWSVVLMLAVAAMLAAYAGPEIMAAVAD